MHTPSLSNAAGWERWSGHLGNGQYLASLGQLWFKRKKYPSIEYKKRLREEKELGVRVSPQQPQAKWASLSSWV